MPLLRLMDEGGEYQRTLSATVPVFLIQLLNVSKQRIIEIHYTVASKAKDCHVTK